MLEQYQELLTQNVLCEDNAQHSAIEALAQLSEQLVLVEHDRQKYKKTSFDFLSKISTNKTKPVIQGLYFYGRVGRGKTMLMDLFYESIPLKRKKRIHFHRFMESIHQELKQLSFIKPKIDNPLIHIAKGWTDEISLLCFDEFFVSDIGDAMLLSGLFEALFTSGITLVTTSNCQPEQLYRNGLQRDRFLPIISLINHREISYLRKSNKHIWFDFFALCSGPRSQRDYMQLADLFDSVLISNVPQFGGKLIPAVFSGVEDSYQRSGVLMGYLQQLDDEARRFIALVDEFYDRKTQLIVSADVDITALYQGQQLSFEFQRCQSRLFEMQKG